MTDEAIALSAEDRHPGSVRGGGRGAGHLVPAAPGQPGPAAAGARAAPATGRSPAPWQPAERQAILDVLHSARFADTAPAKAWAILLDEGIYLGSVSTFYRVLREAGESRERRAQATHPAAVKPELAATGPNQVYSWDITKLHGPAKWTYYHLYVILDIFSRYAVGWMVATRESAVLAEKLIAATCAKQGISPRPAHHPRRPRLLDDVQAGRAAAGRPRRHPVPQPPARQQRQPVLRKRSSRPSSTGRLPAASTRSRQHERTARTSSPGTTTSTATAASACTPPPTSTTAGPQPCGPTGRSC